jgi:hypothetical protein
MANATGVNRPNQDTDSSLFEHHCRPNSSSMVPVARKGLFGGLAQNASMLRLGDDLRRLERPLGVEICRPGNAVNTEPASG